MAYRIIQLVYLMLPVYAANMAAPLARYWPGGARPISEQWLGRHKTWNGYALAIAASTAVCGLQAQMKWTGSLLSYDNWFVIGFACGLAAMLGDSLKSFFKRQLGIAPGTPWIPADQLDFVVAGLLVLSWWVDFRWLDIVSVLGLSFVGDILVNRLSFRMGIKAIPW